MLVMQCQLSDVNCYFFFFPFTFVFAFTTLVSFFFASVFLTFAALFGEVTVLTVTFADLSSSCCAVLFCFCASSFAFLAITRYQRSLRKSKRGPHSKRRK